MLFLSPIIATELFETEFKLTTSLRPSFPAGSFGCASLVNGGGTVADLHNGEKRGLGMALFASAPFLG